MERLMPISIKSAWLNLQRNSRRSALSILIIAVVVFALCCTGGFGLYTYQSLMKETAMSIGHITLSQPHYFEREEEIPLDNGLSDYSMLGKKLGSIPEVHAILPRIEFNGLISNGRKSTIYMGTGIDPQEFAIKGEYWYDGRSWDKSMWKKAFKRAEELSQHTATTDLARSYSYGLDNTSLVAQNVMLHFKMNMSALHPKYLWLEKLEPSLDLLVSPTDGGLVATPRLSYQVYESGVSDMKIELANRFYTGAGNSVYANVPDRDLVFINLKGNL